MKKLQGFTLIELLVVIAIIAILAAILFPVFAQAKAQAKKITAISDVKQIDLGVQMYLNDADDVYPQSQSGNDFKYTDMIFPYVKNDGTDNLPDGNTVHWGKTGIFRSPGNPRAPVALEQDGGFSFGVHHTLFVDNEGYDLTQTSPPNPGVPASVLDAPADKIALMERGQCDEASQGGWQYPWFHDWQQQWIGSIAHVAGDVSTVYRDGDDSVNPSWSGYTPLFDSDCVASINGGAWECGAHARYRWSNVMPSAFADGHAKSISRGQIQWFKNIWIDRRNVNQWNWYYGYLNGAGWGPGPTPW